MNHPKFKLINRESGELATYLEEQINPVGYFGGAWGRYNEITGESDYIVVENIVIPTAEEIQKQLTDAVQQHMDSIAQSKGYDNIFSAATYAEESVIPKFQAEGIAFRKWRSEVWDYCYAYLDDVTNGIKDVPTAESLIADPDFPVLVLP